MCRVFKAIQTLGIMILSFHPVFAADEQVILGVRSPDEGDLDLIRRADAIILPQARANDLQEACLRSKALIFPNYEVRLKYPGKIGQSLLFEDYGFSQPRTLRWPSLQALSGACGGRLDHPPHTLPFLVKADRGHEAESVFLIESRRSLTEALERIRRREDSGQRGFVTQDYVHSEGNALRAVIIGDRIVTYWKRPSVPGALITTIGKGATIDRQWRQDLQQKGREAAKDLANKTGINLAAVDFVFSLKEEDPEPLFLEINYYFARRGLGGNEAYYTLVHGAIRQWLRANALNPDAVRLA
jgi:ribosomal protein S6--L-glutamate ligase